MRNFTIEIFPTLYISVKISETEKFSIFDEIIWIITGIFRYLPTLCLSLYIDLIVPFWFGPNVN